MPYSEALEYTINLFILFFTKVSLEVAFYDSVRLRIDKQAESRLRAAMLAPTFPIHNFGQLPPMLLSTCEPFQWPNSRLETSAFQWAEFSGYLQWRFVCAVDESEAVS